MCLLSSTQIHKIGDLISQCLKDKTDFSIIAKYSDKVEELAFMQPKPDQIGGPGAGKVQAE